MSRSGSTSGAGGAPRSAHTYPFFELKRPLRMIAAARIVPMRRSISASESPSNRVVSKFVMAMGKRSVPWLLALHAHPMPG